jgi:hypothetical protein
MFSILFLNKIIPELKEKQKINVVLNDDSIKILSNMRTILKNKYEAKKIIGNPIITSGIIKSKLFSHIPKEIGNIIQNTSQLETAKYEWNINIGKNNHNRNNQTKINLYITYSNDMRTNVKSTRKNQLKYVKPENEGLNNYYILIRTIIDFLSYYAEEKTRKKIDIYLYLTTHIKIKPNNKMVDWINVNTGLTTFLEEETEINIFRVEEWFKVFIHECIHNLCLDFGSINFDKTKLKNTFMVESDYLLFETYTETWAEIIQILFIDIVEINSGSIMDKLNNELMFSILQCDKMIKICTNNKMANYLDISNRNENVLKNYMEHSNCFCYYILKVIALYNINDFLFWCKKNNKHNILCFYKNHDTTSSIDKFIDFFIDHYKNENMIKTIIEETNKRINNKNSNSFIENTLRMSIYEIKV